jgi:hypothetical protein
MALQDNTASNAAISYSKSIKTLCALSNNFTLCSLASPKVDISYCAYSAEIALSSSPSPCHKSHPHPTPKYFTPKMPQFWVRDAQFGSETPNLGQRRPILGQRRPIWGRDAQFGAETPNLGVSTLGLYFDFYGY